MCRNRCLREGLDIFLTSRLSKNAVLKLLRSFLNNYSLYLTEKRGGKIISRTP